MKQILQSPSDDSKTSCFTTRDIESCDDVIDEFGTDTSLVIALPSRKCCSNASSPFWFTIPEGYYALVSRHGAREDFTDANGCQSCVWPAGLHLGPPWLKVSHLVTKQDFVFNTPIKDCKTKDNVSVEMDLTLVLRVMGDISKGEDPENVYRFVHHVTAKGLQQQLLDAQSESVRTLTRSINHTDIFGLRTMKAEVLEEVKEKLSPTGSINALLPPTNSEIFSPAYQLVESKEHDTDDEKDDVLMIENASTVTPEKQLVAVEKNESTLIDIMKDRLNCQFMPQGIEILDVVFQRISLPDKFMKLMAQKAINKSQFVLQKLQHELDMTALLQNETVRTLNQSTDEKRLELKKDGELESLQESIEYNLEAVKVEDTLKHIKCQQELDVNLALAESDATIHRIAGETELEVQRIKLESETEAAIAMVESAGEVEYIEVEAELKGALNEAKGEKAIIRAEGISAPKLKRFNEYITMKKRIEAQDALARNDKLIVTGTSGGKAANRLIIQDAILRDRKIGQGLSRSEIISQTAVATGKAQVILHVGNQRVVEL